MYIYIYIYIFFILINKALNLFENNGTLLDGELIYHDSQWNFYVHDRLILCGNKINRELIILNVV